MKNNSPIFPCVSAALALCICALGCGPDFAGNYQIDLVRAREVGDQFTISAKGEWHNSFDEIIKERVQEGTYAFTEVELKARGQVMSVDANNIPTKLRYTIQEYRAVRENRTVESLEPGAVFTVLNQSPHLDFGVYQDKVSEEESKVLRVLLAPRMTDGTLMTEMLTPETRKQVGDSWVARTPYRELIEPYDNMRLLMNEVAGEVVLSGAEKVNNVDAIQLDAKLDFRQVYILKEDLPKYASRKGSSATWEYTCSLPLNRNWGALHEKSRLKMNIELDLRRGRAKGNIQRLLTMERSYEYPEKN